MSTAIQSTCYHCGEVAPGKSILLGEKIFCCTGCRSVYSILHQNELDGYYCLNDTPGNSMKEYRKTSFSFLDDSTIASKLITFKNDKQSQVMFYLPQMHCSSCLWLLENLYKLEEGVVSSHVNFTNKQVNITFLNKTLSLRQVAERLASIGYEPYITLEDYEKEKKKPQDRQAAIKLGIAGFCFANIMLISFPEYLGLEFTQQKTLSSFFRYVNLLLSLPVFFYAAQEFFVNAWASIRQRFLIIDAPIALAVGITFVRSVYEILSESGPGYLDSMSGIVFFMLIGRLLQKRTFTTLRFNRDYKSYFPIAVNTSVKGQEQLKKIQDLSEGDLIHLQHHEIIPVDGLLSSKSAEIDYSFVTGENELNKINAGDVVYAGGKIQSAHADVLAIKPFSQNSFTALWNNSAFKESKTPQQTFVDTISKYFSIFLLLLAAGSFFYWQIVYSPNAWNALTAVLIVACPCTLLLAASYTYGFMIDYFSREGMFVKNENTINRLQQITHIVFDKTGTLSEVNQESVKFHHNESTDADLRNILSVIKNSSHPLSKSISKHYLNIPVCEVIHFKEVAGQGAEAWLDEQYIKIGTAAFVGVDELNDSTGSNIYFSIDGKKSGHFQLSTALKPGVEELLKEAGNTYQLSLLSGDNEATMVQMKHLFPKDATLLYRQSPQQKLDYIKSLQEKGEIVMMVGDGINDAGALKQSDIGISVVESHFSFSPASDAILNSKRTADLFKFIRSAMAIKKLIIGTFIYSLLYNVIGLSIAVSANLKPITAAILMPASSISVILIAYLGTRFIYKKTLLKH